MNYEQLIEAKTKLIELNGVMAIVAGSAFILAGIAVFSFSVLRKSNVEILVPLSVLLWFLGLAPVASGIYRKSNSRLIAEASIMAIGLSK